MLPPHLSAGGGGGGDEDEWFKAGTFDILANI